MNQTIREVSPFRHAEGWLASPRTITAMLALLALSACAPTVNWRRAQRLGTYEAYMKYLTDYPSSRFCAAARTRAEERLWSAADSANTEDAYARFLVAFPDGRFSAEATCRREELAWQRTRAADQANSYAQFLDKFPQSVHAADAQRRRDELVWQLARSADTPGEYAYFLKKFPGSEHAAEAQQRLDEIEKAAWDTAVDENTVAALKSFADAHPTSIHVDEARRKIVALEERARQEEERARQEVERAGKSLAQRAKAVLDPLRPGSTATVEVLLASVSFSSGILGVFLDAIDLEHTFETDFSTAIKAGLVRQTTVGGNPIAFNQNVDCNGWRVRLTCTRHPEYNNLYPVTAIEVLGTR